MGNGDIWVRGQVSDRRYAHVLRISIAIDLSPHGSIRPQLQEPPPFAPPPLLTAVFALTLRVFGAPAIE